MPAYEFRCQECQQESTLLYKSVAAYNAATPQCPHCQSTRLTRLIRSVQVQQPSRDYASMSSDDMLRVLESGDSKQANDMIAQVQNSPKKP